MFARVRHPVLFRQEKRAARGCKRPKSREETPKEGGGNARNRATALQQYVSASHKKQGPLTYFHNPLPAADIRISGAEFSADRVAESSLPAQVSMGTHEAIGPIKVAAIANRIVPTTTIKQQFTGSARA